MPRSMMRKTIRTSCWLAFLVAASLAFAQTDFSAEIADTGKSDTTTQAKIYMAKDKIRIEPAAGSAKGKGSGGSVIMNLATQTTTVLMEQQHMYMEMPVQMANQRVAYNFFRTGDVENACTDWAQNIKNKGGTCHKAGTDTVNGRSTIRYEGTNANGEPLTFWIDPKLRFPVKWQGKNSSGELRNIQEGTQPASLFEVPADFKKFDMGNMGGMMQRPQ